MSIWDFYRECYRDIKRYNYVVQGSDDQFVRFHFLCKGATRLVLAAS